MFENQAAVGVFDSGVGGLTVVREIEKLLPKESILYLGDTARVPYGTKSPDTVIRYARSCANVLVSREIKLLVVACNTASAFALETLRADLDISDPELVVFSQPCPLFVPLAEEGWTNGDVPLSVARTYLAPLLQQGIDTLVLGCTHYPLLKGVIAQAAGDGITLVDSADETAAVVQRTLDGMDRRSILPLIPQFRFFVTDAPEMFMQVGERFLGHALQETEWVDV
jgi:glutamate racemase